MDDGKPKSPEIVRAVSHCIPPRRSGGIGRRTGFRCQRSQGRGGSSPFFGRNNHNNKTQDSKLLSESISSRLIRSEEMRCESMDGRTREKDVVELKFPGWKLAKRRVPSPVIIIHLSIATPSFDISNFKVVSKHRCPVSTFFDIEKERHESRTYSIRFDQENRFF